MFDSECQAICWFDCEDSERATGVHEGELDEFMLTIPGPIAITDRSYAREGRVKAVIIKHYGPENSDEGLTTLRSFALRFGLEFISRPRADLNIDFNDGRYYSARNAPRPVKLSSQKVLVQTTHPVLGKLYWEFTSNAGCNYPDSYSITDRRGFALQVPSNWREHDYFHWQYRSHIYKVFDGDDQHGHYSVVEDEETGEVLQQNLSGLLGEMQIRSGQSVEEFRLWMFRAVWVDVDAPKDFSETLATITDDQRQQLDTAECRYISMIGMITGFVSDEVVATDRLAYPSLIKQQGGRPLYSDDDCAMFMVSVTGLPNELCEAWVDKCFHETFGRFMDDD